MSSKIRGSPRHILIIKESGILSKQFISFNFYTKFMLKILLIYLFTSPPKPTCISGLFTFFIVSNITNIVFCTISMEVLISKFFLFWYIFLKVSN
jgi:hypothetical protein